MEVKYLLVGIEIDSKIINICERIIDIPIQVEKMIRK